MTSRMFKLPLRPSHEDADQCVLNTGSNGPLASPNLIQSSTPAPTTHYTSHDAKDDQQRKSFLRRRFSSVWAQKSEDVAAEEVRGPLGLRLLFASSEPMIDIIFVHGLRGGSIKTWQKGRDPRLFWPQHWLPIEAEFRNARIHSFGYEADWKSSQPSILSIHDFGQALYEEMRSSPMLRRNPRSPIILVGHSMGGLVIKKAHTLAHRDRDQCDIAERIRAIVFLATPHKGSDYAALLNNILKLSGFAGMSSSREYIDDLTIGSKSTQLINEEFKSSLENLSVFSFYETLPTSIGMSSTIIVDKDSAVLGLGSRRERVTYLNANHGNMCKFRDPSDPNYLSVKNTLGSVVQDLLEDALAQNKQLASSTLRSLRSFLGASDHLEDHHEKLDGSCQWIDYREDYKTWRDATPEFDTSNKCKPSVYWVTANPGAGKTVLVAHIESQLEEFGLQHGTFYFKFGKKESHSLSSLLRSLAFQMARSDAAVRETLMRHHDEASTLDLDDARAIWSKIFRTGILQIPTLAPQYWLIDAIDECIAYPELFSLLKGARIAFPLKIFITSRKLADMSKLVRQLNEITLRLVEIPVQDTMRDIELYIASRMADLPVESGEEASDLTLQIIAKSNASFLWVRLVMDELEGVYGHESIVQVLQGIPEGMVSYYKRTTEEMAENKRERHIAKTILQWVVMAARPLSTIELAHALSLDVRSQLANPKSAIEGLCGHLVSIDAECDRVQIIHNTAREFLSSDDAGYFCLSQSETHERIALVCLKLLCVPEMQPPRHRKLLEQKRHKKGNASSPLPLLDYAISHFSDHVFSASASSDELLAELSKFLSSTTLTWIDKLATGGHLHGLVETARNLKAYLIRRLKYSSPSDRQVVCVDSWATDLGKLAIKFHSALSTNPQSIYFLIPPLCPTESAIYRQYRWKSDSLAVLGPTNQYWGDCVATLKFAERGLATVACGENLIAVGFESGDISFYNNRSQETDLAIHNDVAIDLLQFDPQGLYIVGSSRRFLMLWGLQGNLLWKTRVRVRFFQLAFSSAHVIGITQQGRVLKWTIEAGDLVDEQVFTYQPPDDNESSHGRSFLVPFAAAANPSLELVALAYRNGPVCLFDFESTVFITWALDSQERCPHHLIFHPNSAVSLLLVIYNESHMSLFESWSGTLVHEFEPEKRIICISAACSPSGDTFATVDVQGTLRIWDFESLAILYHVMTPNHSFRILKFSSDSFNILDINDHEMKVWSPSVLLSKTAEEVGSSDQPEVSVALEGQFEILQSARIRAFAAHGSHSVLFVGKNNGDVALHNLTNGKEAGVLYTHLDSVSYIASCRGSVIATSDVFNIIQVWTLVVQMPDKIQAGELKFKSRAASSIRQLLLDDDGEYLLVSTTLADSVYRTSDGAMMGSMKRDHGEKSSFKWIAMPNNGQGSIFALIHNHILSYYTASAFPASVLAPPITLKYTIEQGHAESSIDAVLVNPSTTHLVLQYSQKSAHAAYSSVAVFRLPTTALGAAPPTLYPLPVSWPPAASKWSLKHSLGFTSPGNRLLFLRKDSWVCSLPLDGETPRYAQHFFVPHEYTTTNSDILPIQTSGDDFVFCLFDTVAIFKHGLRFQEYIDVEHF